MTLIFCVPPEEWLMVDTELLLYFVGDISKLSASIPAELARVG